MIKNNFLLTEALPADAHIAIAQTNQSHSYSQWGASQWLVKGPICSPRHFQFFYCEVEFIWSQRQRNLHYTVQIFVKKSRRILLQSNISGKEHSITMHASWEDVYNSKIYPKYPDSFPTGHEQHLASQTVTQVNHESRYLFTWMLSKNWPHNTT